MKMIHDKIRSLNFEQVNGLSEVQSMFRTEMNRKILMKTHRNFYEF